MPSLILALGSVLAAPLTAAPKDAAAPAAPMPTPQFRHYEVSNGLPSSDVYNVVQDARGLLWMGTKNGLVHFDGVHFKVYRHEPRNRRSLSGNDISAVMIDHRHRLWVGGSSTGLNLFRPATGDFRTWRHITGDPDSIASNDIMTLAAGTDGSIWIGLMGRGLDRMLPDGRFRHYRTQKGHPDSLSSGIVTSVRVFKDGSLLVGGFGGLDRMSADGTIRHVRFQGLKNPPRVWGINGKPGHIRVATAAGLYRLGADDVARRMLAGVIPADLTVTSARGPDGSLWVGGLDGLYWIGPHGRHRHFAPHMQASDGVPGTLIWSLTFDEEGGLWVTTRDGGVAYLCPMWKQFIVFRRHPGDPNSVDIDRVSSILADGPDLLVGGDHGTLDRVNPATDAVTHMHLGRKMGSVMALAHAGHGGLWIGRTKGVQLKVHGHVRKVGGRMFPGGVNRIVSDARGDAYATIPTGGVYRIDRSSLHVTKMKFRDDNPRAGDVNAIAMHDGHLWVASMGGLYRQQGHGNTLVPVSGVVDGRVISFAFDSDGIWLARTDSLDHYHFYGLQGSRDRMIGTDEGWPEVDVVSMSSDHEGRVWLTTRTGLWRFDPKQDSFRSYGADDGLPSPEFSVDAVARLPDGTEYTGTMHGVVGWNPARVHDHSSSPRLQLKSVTVNRKGVTHALPADGSPLHLRWNDRELRVTAQAVSYLDPARNHYRFRLDGLDSGWINTGTRGERDFTTLAHGNYRLHVEAAGPNGAWTLLKPLLIHVSRPPWMTWWAWATYVLLAMSMILMAAMLARRRIEQRHRMQMAERERTLAEQASAAKTSFLATLGHEIRTPMTGVLGMSELLLRSSLEPRQREYAEAIHRSGTLLLRLVNEALDMARIEAGRLELDTDPFDPREAVRDVVQLQSGVAQVKGLTLASHIAEDVPRQVLGDALRVKQILLNLVNNALKFTSAGSVTVGLEWMHDGLCFSVVDTGSGVPEQSRGRLFQRYEQADSPQRRSGSGLGLAICRELSTLMGGYCELAGTGAEGSTFRVWLPLEVVEEVPVAAEQDEVSTVSWDLLLVEDDMVVAEVIRGLLESQGHRVRHAVQGLAGLSEVESGGFDAVLLDLDLPGLDGFELARMLRKRGVRIPIIAITARSGADDEARSHEAGMDGFLRKPLSGEQLRAKLTELIHERD